MLQKLFTPEGGFVREIDVPSLKDGMLPDVLIVGARVFLYVDSFYATEEDYPEGVPPNEPIYVECLGFHAPPRPEDLPTPVLSSPEGQPTAELEPPCEACGTAGGGHQVLCPRIKWGTGASRELPEEPPHAVDLIEGE